MSSTEGNTSVPSDTMGANRLSVCCWKCVLNSGTLALAVETELNDIIPG